MVWDSILYTGDVVIWQIWFGEYYNGEKGCGDCTYLRTLILVFSAVHITTYHSLSSNFCSEFKNQDPLIGRSGFSCDGSIGFLPDSLRRNNAILWVILPIGSSHAQAMIPYP